MKIQHFYKKSDFFVIRICLDGLKDLGYFGGYYEKASGALSRYWIRQRRTSVRCWIRELANWLNEKRWRVVINILAAGNGYKVRRKRLKPRGNCGFGYLILVGRKLDYGK